jgi:hypothetical protein
VAGHSIEECIKLRQKIHELINAGSIKLNPIEQETTKPNDQAEVDKVTPEGSINFIEEDNDQDVEVNGLFKLEICLQGEQKRDVIISSPADPLIINAPKKPELVFQTPTVIPESKTLTASDVVITNITGIGGMTRSGRCYSPEELERRRKGKDKAGKEPVLLSLRKRLQSKSQ